MSFAKQAISEYMGWIVNGEKVYRLINSIININSLPEISGHGPIFSVYSSVYAIVEVNGRRWELGIKHRR